MLPTHESNPLVKDKGRTRRLTSEKGIHTGGGGGIGRQSLIIKYCKSRGKMDSGVEEQSN